MANKYTQIRRWLALGDNCHYCGAPFGGPAHLAKTADHKIPLSRIGGSNHSSNIVASCYGCNHEKGNMTDAEFMEWRKRGKPNKKKYLREIGLVVPGREVECASGSVVDSEAATDPHL